MKIHDLATLLKHKYLKPAVLILIIMAIIPYIFSLHNDFVSDDVGGILKNPAIGQFSSVTSQPLTFLQNLIYFVTYHLFGLSSFFFRLPNVLFHTGSTIMLFFAASMLLGLEIGFFSALLFAVHPLNSEAVLWISAASYPRYAFFVLASFCAYLLSLSGKTKPKKKIWYSVSFLMFLLGLFSSEKAIIVPLVLFVFHVADRSVKTHIKNLLPFFVGTLVFAIPNIFQIGVRITDTHLEYGQGSQTFINPLVQIPVAIQTYLTLLFFPDKLDFFHTNLVFNPISIVILVSFAFALIFAYIKNKLIFFWLSFFLIALSPTLIPLRIASTVAERYTYLATAGVISAVIAIAFKIAQKWHIQKYLIGLLIFLVLILTARTIVRSGDWKNEDTLAVAGARTSPNTISTHMNLVNMYTRAGRIEDAIGETHKALSIEPSYAKGLNNLGYLYAQIGQFDNAMKAYSAALKINPTMWEVHDNLAGLYTAQKNYDLAIRHELLAIRYSNGNIDLYLHLGIIYTQMGDKEKAKEAFETVLKFNPTNVQVTELLQAVD